MKRLLILFLLASLIATGINAQQKQTPYVILISFDGFRHDYVKNFKPQNFKAFIKKGTEAESIIPSFPSKTFPNHYTIVTGLVPGHHGLVDNQFYDSSRRSIYGMRDKIKVTDPYYYAGIPLWQLAKQNGVKSASYFWVGSELTDENRRPDYYYPFDDSVLPEVKVKQVLSWLELPDADRPHLITLYFSSPDHEGHTYGPNSIEAKAAVLKADTLLGKLMSGLRKIKLPVNVIIVSDHGMHELPTRRDTFIFLNEVINRSDTSVIAVNGGTQVHFYVRNLRKRDSLYQYLKAKDKTFSVYKRDEFPARWNYKTSRSGDILLAAYPQHYIRSDNWDDFIKTTKEGSLFGVHGYDPENVPDMRGIFYAQGPNIKSGMTIPSFQNIHVYPLIARILGLPLPKIDGKMEVLEGIYVDK